ADPNSIPTIGWIISIVATALVIVTLLGAPERTNQTLPRQPTWLKDYFAVFTNPSMFRLILADLFLVLGPGASAPIYLFFFHEAKGFSPADVSVLLIPYG